jgi:hypothetical protein
VAVVPLFSPAQGGLAQGDGVTQKPIEGASKAYSFDNPEARDLRSFGVEVSRFF